jgi:outer membrane protein assembly factor BamB/tetratricopeptide (TPR) repeat protein
MEEPEMAFKEQAFSRRFTVLVLLMGAFVVLPSLAVRAMGQDEEQPAENGEGEARTYRNYEVSADGLNNSIQLNEADVDSSEIIGHLHSALASQERGEWIDALTEYYYVINSPSDFLYKRSGLDQERVYIGLKEFCRQQLESFPEEGKLAFKAQYENAVKALYEKAQADLDLDTLRMIHFNYALSTYSGDALLLTANVLYEGNRINEAFSYYNRLITRQPEMHQPISVAYAGLGKCALNLGASVLPIMRDRRKELEGELGDQKMVIADESGAHVETTLRKFTDDVIAKLEAMADKAATAAAAETIDISMFNRLQLQWKTAANLGMAAFWTGELFGNKLFIDPMGSPTGIRVLDVNTGKTINVLGSMQSRKQDFTSAVLPGDELVAQAVSEDADNYYAAMPYNLKKGTVPGFGLVERWGTRLLAFSRRTNKLIWYWTDPADQNVAGVPVSRNEDRQFMSEIYMTSAPVRNGAYLYAGAVRVAKPATLEYYIICLDAATGAIRWRTYIGNNTPMPVGYTEPSGGGALMPAAGSNVCVANDTVFFTSNMGAVGAVNAITGDVKWAAKYHKPPTYFTGNGTMIPDPLCVWYASAPLYMPNVVRKGANGRDENISMLVVAPRDSDHLYAFDPETGKRIWDRPMRATDNVPLSPDSPPMVMTELNGKAMIFQSGLDETRRVRAEQEITDIRRDEERVNEEENPPQEPAQPPAQPAQQQAKPLLTKTQMIDLAIGTEAPFYAYLGQDAVVLGKPATFGPLVVLLTSSVYKGQTTYAIIVYDTSKNDKIVLYKEIGDMCEGKRVYRMFISGEKVAFLCDGAVYVYGSGAPATPPTPTPTAAP